MYQDTAGRPVRPLWWINLFLLAAVLWSVGIQRPVDLPNWHEFDYSAIARSFSREGSNILLPRIDWRGDGPGYTEMEFPLIPWIMSRLYLVFGIHEFIGRGLSLVFTLCSLWTFRRLAVSVLPEAAAFIATLFVLVNHEMIIVATAILPEPLMLLCSLLAVYYFVHWYEDGNWLSYLLAVCAFSLAMLVKSPAAHLAIFFFIWSLIKDGLGAFRKFSLYLFAVLSFLLPVLWYIHAASLWHRFHNSMGVSNEDHWFGLDILRRPKVIINFVSLDVVYVFGVGAVLVILAAFIARRSGPPANRLSVNRLGLAWGLAAATYLFVIIRTSGQNWAAYYHVVAVPPAALLFGSGVFYVNTGHKQFPWRTILVTIAAAAALLSAGLLWLARRDANRMPGVFRDLVVHQPQMPGLLVLVVLASASALLCSFLSRLHSAPIQSSSPLVYASVIGCFTYFFISLQLLLGSWKGFETRSADFVTAAWFKDKLPLSGLIVASGGICQDVAGHRLANDAPQMFYWLDRQGFTTCQGTETIAELQADQKRGARYFIVQRGSLLAQPAFELDLRKTYPLLASGPAALVFRLDSPLP